MISVNTTSENNGDWKFQIEMIEEKLDIQHLGNSGFDYQTLDLSFFGYEVSIAALFEEIK